MSVSQWSLGRTWSKWGFGPQQGEAYEDSKYPVAQIQELENNFPQYTSRFLEVRQVVQAAKQIELAVREEASLMETSQVNEKVSSLVEAVKVQLREEV